MIDFIGPGLDLASEIFKYVNKNNSRKYLDRIVKLKLALASELSKALYHQDDKRVEELRAEIIIIMEAAKQELDLIKAENEKS